MLGEQGLQTAVDCRATEMWELDPAQNRHGDEWNRAEDLDVQPQSYSLLILDSSSNGVGKVVYPHGEG